MNGVGSIVFGPQSKPTERQYWRNVLGGYSVNAGIQGHPCNCLGPQPGETKCPCALLSESEQGRKMIADGVTINGKRYKLVEAD